MTLSAEDRKKDDSNFLAVIRWHKDDIRYVLNNRLRRLVTDKDVDAVAERINRSVLKSRNIEEGWTILEQLVDDALAESGIKEE